MKRILFQKVIVITSLLMLLVIESFTIYKYFFLNIPSNSLIPQGKSVLPIVHFVCIILSIYLLFKDNLKIQVLVLQIESIISLLTNFEIFGIFLFHSSVFFLYINYFNSSKLNKYAVYLFIFHFIMVLHTHSRGIDLMIVYFFISLFMYFVFYYFTELLKEKYSCFVPKAIKTNSNISDLKPGSVLKLSSLNLTQRQIDFIYDFVINNMSHKQLSEKYYVSISTVKKEFSDLYKVFGVTKLEEFHILLLQYIIEK